MILQSMTVHDSWWPNIHDSQSAHQLSSTIITIWLGLYMGVWGMMDIKSLFTQGNFFQQLAMLCHKIEHVTSLYLSILLATQHCKLQKKLNNLLFFAMLQSQFQCLTFNIAIKVKSQSYLFINMMMCARLIKLAQEVKKDVL